MMMSTCSRSAIDATRANIRPQSAAFECDQSNVHRLVPLQRKWKTTISFLRIVRKSRTVQLIFTSGAAAGTELERVTATGLLPLASSPASTASSVGVTVYELVSGGANALDDTAASAEHP